MASQSQRKETFAERLDRYQNLIEECLPRQNKLKPKDRDFLNSVSRFGVFSDLQMKWLDDIARRCGVSGEEGRRVMATDRLF